MLEDVEGGRRLRGSRLRVKEDIEVTAVGGLLEGHIGRGHGGGGDSGGAGRGDSRRGRGKVEVTEGLGYSDWFKVRVRMAGSGSNSHTLHFCSGGGSMAKL